MLLVGVAIVVGLALLAWAPDRFVEGSAGLADRWGVSRIVIGAVVIGFGTSSPELLVSGVASAQGDPAVGIGNIVGSNMANLGLIVAVAALVGHVAVPHGLIRRELPLVVTATVLFALLVRDGLTRGDGVVLAVGLVVAMAIVMRGAMDHDDEDIELEDEVEDYLEETDARGAGRLALDVLVGLLGTLAGAQLLVSGAVDVADRAGLSEGFVGMTLVALGTSLPELVTAVAAAKAGEDQLILGNVLGSNLFNSLGVGAVVAVAGGATAADVAVSGWGVGLMLAITALATYALVSHKIVTRGEALTLLVTYLGCLPLLAG